ncbi:MAG: TerC family protein [Cyclobacteriaceae bacterium]
MFEVLTQPESYIALLTLIFLEIVLGVDNIIFISIVSNKLPEEQRAKARNIGLLAALGFRIALLLGITWIIGFTKPLFTILEHDFSGRDLILMAGGVFLIFKSTMEVHNKMEGAELEGGSPKSASMLQVIGQIILLDIIFSFDSILTAVGLTQEIVLMVIAVVVAMIVMMTFAGQISKFISEHPTLEILALSFLILIGFMLLIEGFHYHVPKGYIYFAVFFSLVVEILNMKIRKSRKPVKLNKRIKQD